MGPGGYPIEVDVEEELDGRNRLTAFFRPILAIPHTILVGSPGLQAGYGAGLFGILVGLTSFFAWFAILFTGRYPRGLWDLAYMYMRWRTRAFAYSALLRDEYPPFGEARYPAWIQLEYPEQSNRLTTFFRPFLAIPHVFVLLFVTIAWVVSLLIAWFAILFTGRFPEGLYRFGAGYMRWSQRVQAYVLLMRDEYPPFSLQP